MSWKKKIDIIIKKVTNIELAVTTKGSDVQSNREDFLLPSDLPGPSLNPSSSYLPGPSFGPSSSHHPGSSSSDLPGRRSSSNPDEFFVEMAETFGQLAKGYEELDAENERMVASFSAEQNNEESFDVENEQCSSFQEYVHKRFLYAVNTYSMENLIKIKGIGKSIAKQIIQYREESEDPRPFKRLADLEIIELPVKVKWDGILEGYTAYLYNEDDAQNEKKRKGTTKRHARKAR